MSFHCEQLVTIFNDLFKASEQTILISGGSEPLYIPQGLEYNLNQIIFTQDYFSSALHEIAHWCIAGPARRKLVDYGYWYNPDGRNSEQQKIFEQAEVKPQALEWIFSTAAGIRFFISADNLAANNTFSTAFKQNIYQQAIHYLQNGLPIRAELFKQALLQFYQRAEYFDLSLFNMEYLLE